MEKAAAFWREKDDPGRRRRRHEGSPGAIRLYQWKIDLFQGRTIPGQGLFRARSYREGVSRRRPALGYPARCVMDASASLTCHGHLTATNSQSLSTSSMYS